MFYLITYIWSLLVFSIALTRENSENWYLIDLVFGDNVSKSLLTLVIFSMGGLPPLVGFISKYFIWVSLTDELMSSYNNYWTLYAAIIVTILIVTMITSVISTFYYLRFIKIMWFTPTRRYFQTRDFREAVYAHGWITILVVFPLLGWPLFIHCIGRFFNYWSFVCCFSEKYLLF
jgi:NADH-quinone oxidoreductase subunit N